MTQDAPLLSVVIPSRNRMDYAKSAIRSVLSIPCSELELVVEDNSDSNQLETRIRGTVIYIAPERAVFRQRSSVARSPIIRSDQPCGLSIAQNQPNRQTASRAGALLVSLSCEEFCNASC